MPHAYRRVGAAHRRIPTALGQVAPREATVHDSKAGRAVNRCSTACGAIHLARADEPLTIRMLREAGRDVTEFPGGGEHLVVFVHGLFEDERAWEWEAGSFGERLERDLGVTALHVRYNSGLRISDNGASFER